MRENIKNESNNKIAGNKMSINSLMSLMIGCLGAINGTIGVFTDNYNIYFFGIGILIADIIFMLEEMLR